MNPEGSPSELGDRLIFLISQPRSGSTLLQHMLGGHPDIHTLPEPWFMLPLVYAFGHPEIETDYNGRFAYLALHDFLDRIREGRGVLTDAQRRMAWSLYHAALEGSGKRYFLDKTTRYYQIIPDLHVLFPRARFVFLLRNPLAVLSSLLDVSLGGRWDGFAQAARRHDILTAPRRILEGIQRLEPQATVVRYEDLVSGAEDVLRNACLELGLSFDPQMLEYGGKVRFDGTAWVDPKSIYRHSTAVPDYRDAWSDRLLTRGNAPLARAYLDALGRDTVDALGYSYDDLRRSLGTRGGRGPATYAFRKLMSDREPGILGRVGRVWLRLRLSVENRGVWGTLHRAIHRTMSDSR